MAENTIGWFGVREKYYLLADKSWLISQIRPSEQAGETVSALVPTHQAIIDLALGWAASFLCPFDGIHGSWLLRGMRSLHSLLCWRRHTPLLMLHLSFSVLMGNGGIPIQGTVPVLMQLTTHGGFVCTSAWSWALFGSLHASTISWWVPLGISFASRIFVDSIFSIRQIILETLSNGDIEMFIGPFSHLCCSLEQWCYRHV